MKAEFILLLLIAACSSLFAQINNESKLDSSFTLAKRIHKDKLAIAQHGIYFNEKTRQVFKDFSTIEKLGLTYLSGFNKQVIYEGNHLIKIWTDQKSADNISKIIEINSVYFIDTSENDQKKFKDTIFYDNYIIQFSDTNENVQYETIKRQGVSKYSIGTREVVTNREMILTGLFFIDNKKEIGRLLNKYNLAQNLER